MARIEIKMKSTHKTPYEAIDPNQPGKQVIYNNGKVVKVVTVTGQATHVEQSFGELLNINKLLEPAIKKGLLRNAIKYEGEYDDYPNFDFQTAQFQLARAQTMFEQLPSPVRVRFENQPGKFLEFVNNPNNKDEIRKMGLSKGLDNKRADGSIITPAPTPPAPTPPAPTPPAPTPPA